ncbi:MAG: acetoacetate--CoA ligase [Thiohalocapsa sp.]
MSASGATGKPLWTPDPDRAIGCSMAAFTAIAATETGNDFDDYAALHRWSVEQPDQFWPLVWRFCEIRSSAPWTRVIDDPHAMPGARWFSGARLNFAQNLLRFLEERPEAPALIFRGENGERLVLNLGELGAQVAALTAWLREAGVQPGDRVAALMPNRPETIVALLATASIGALWSSASPDFGVDGVIDRFGQIEPKVLIGIDGYHYAGKRIDIRDKLTQVSARLPTREQVLVVPWLFADIPFCGTETTPWPDMLKRHQGAPLVFAQFPFDHPLYILFSSGTTGRPKCILHGAGGTLLQHLKELVLHTDLGLGDRLFYFATCGWMMWNWMVSGLAAGATLVLFDGSPFHPGPDVLWNMAEQERVSVFGTSAKYISALQKAGMEPARSQDLSALRALLSTGSPLAPESFDYAYGSIKADLQLASISGGTDIASCFALGNPMLPVHRGELQCRGLGLAVEVFDDTGQAVTGKRGELVCTKPFPCMPLRFWDDPDGTRYRAAYFERFPGVWTHGDFAELTQNGGLIIHGRSDAVLNPGGVRIGTAELYRVVEAMGQVTECLAIGQKYEGDERILLFVVLRPGQTLDDSLRSMIRSRVRERLTPRHVPAKLFQVPEIPRTRSGKIVELAVRDLIHGREVGNREALANPWALDLFSTLPGLHAD